MEKKGKYLAPGTLTIMVIYLVLSFLGYVALFWVLSGKWPIG